MILLIEASDQKTLLCVVLEGVDQHSIWSFSLEDLLHRDHLFEDGPEMPLWAASIPTENMGSGGE